MKLLHLIYLLCIAIVVNGEFTSPSNCGIRPVSKIVNGNTASAGDWGWSVSMNYQGQHFCGGVLISDEWILTAAHCFAISLPIDRIEIDIGLHNRNNKESWVQTVKPSKIISHVGFDMTTSVLDDIALVKLKQPINFDNKYIIPACLPESFDGSLNFDSQNKTAWITGWGATELNGMAQIEKMELEMSILTNARCKQLYNELIDTQAQLCANELDSNSGACQGDSGGPFVRQMEDGRYYLIGLISFGLDCGMGTVFTRVTHYLPWIKSNIANNLY